MKLKYLSALIFGVVLSLPVQAQVYLDSTEVANILHPKAVTAVQPKETSTANDVSAVSYTHLTLPTICSV